jgi:hypothetical protein
MHSSDIDGDVPGGWPTITEVPNQQSAQADEREEIGTSRTTTDDENMSTHTGEGRIHTDQRNTSPVGVEATVFDDPPPGQPTEPILHSNVVDGPSALSDPLQSHAGMNFPSFFLTRAFFLSRASQLEHLKQTRRTYADHQELHQPCR